MAPARRLFIAFVTAALCGAALCPAGPAAAQGDDLASLVGKPAPPLQPDFAFNDKNLSLAKFKGKVVLLTFWAAYSDPSVNALKRCRDWHKDYQNDGLAVVGATLYASEFGKRLTLDPLTGLVEAEKGVMTKKAERDLLDDFARFHKLTFPLWVVPEDGVKAAKEDYHLKGGIPILVLIDRKGVVAAVKGDATVRSLDDMEAAIRKALKAK